MSLIGILPALAAILYTQSAERESARGRTLENNLRITRLAARQQAGLLNGARRLLLTLAHVPVLRLVYEGVPDRIPPSGGKEALRELGVPPGAPVIGNVAALTDHKDHATLIAAAGIVVGARPEAHFVIVGEGGLRPELEARVGAGGLQGRVLFAGFRDDVDRLLPAFDVFCLSSHLEGLGTSLLDAMAFGRAVVATAAGGIPEAVEHGITGQLVPVRDPARLAQALLDLLGDPERRRAMGEAGRRRFLDRFTADHMVDETLRVYAELR